MGIAVASQPSIGHLPVWFPVAMVLAHVLFWYDYVFMFQDDWMMWLFLLVPVYPIPIRWE